MKKRQFLNINTVNELALQLKLPLDFLIKTSEQIDNSYNVFYKKFIKKDGSEKIRKFFEGNKSLKIIHKRINKLLDCVQYPNSIQGGIIGNSILTNATIHSGKKHIANFDIAKFFPSIDYHVVNQAWLSLKCAPDVSRLLTRLTTADAHLPQGFATSPKISGLVLFEINMRLAKLFKRYGFKYSFWIDDLTISGNRPIKKFENIICKIFQQSGFKINTGKTKFTDNKHKQTCTGLTINYRPNADKSIREKVRKELYLCKKFGVDNFLNKHNVSINKKTYLKRLKGKIDFLCSINSKDLIYKKTFQKIITQPYI